MELLPEDVIAVLLAVAVGGAVGLSRVACTWLVAGRPRAHHAVMQALLADAEIDEVRG